MEKEKVFNNSIVEVNRQIAIAQKRRLSEYNKPIQEGEGLKACLRGLVKINRDSELKKLIKSAMESAMSK